MQLKRITDGDLKEKSPAAGGYGGLRVKCPVAERFFSNFLEKNSSFNAIWITFHTFSESFEKTKILRFERLLKKSLTLLLVKTKTYLNFAFWG